MFHAHTSGKPAHPARHTGFALLVLCYALALFHRTALPGVLPAIMAEFDVGAVELASLSVAFFWVCVAGIVIAGPLTDAFGSRVVCTTGALLVAAGSLVFAGAGSFGGLLVARMLISAGSAATFVAMMCFVLIVCSPGGVAGSGRAVMIGNLGALALGTAPAVALAWFDWRLIWIILGLVATALAALVWTVVPETSPVRGWPNERSHLGGGRAFRMSIRAFRSLAASSSVLAGTVFAGGLAGSFYGFADAVAPDLLAAHGLERTAAGWALGALVAGHAAGALVWAWSAGDKRQRRLSLMAAPAGAFTCWYGMMFLPPPSPAGLVMLLIGAGFCTGAFVLAYTPVIARHPMARSGGVVAMVTVGIALVAGLVTALTGALTPGPALGLLLLCALLSFVVSRSLAWAAPAARERALPRQRAPLQVIPEWGSAPGR